MPRISEMPRPGPLTGLELVPAIQGGGHDANRGVPLLLTGAPFGGAVLALRVPMVADLGSIADGDPGAGRVRWNDTEPSQATVLYVSDEDGEAGDLATPLAALAVGGYVYLQGGADSEARNNLQKWQVLSIDSAPGYTKVGVAPQASAGAFADLDDLELTFQQPLPAPGLDRRVVTSVASIDGTTALDVSLGDYFTTELTEDTTLVMLNVPQACTVSLRITQDAVTAREVVFPLSFLARDGSNLSVPETLGARHRLIATTDDYGASWDVDIGKEYQ